MAPFIVSVLLLVSFGSPILVSLYLCIFKGRGVPGRWLFAIAAPSFAYGLLSFATLVFFGPWYLVATFLTPTARAQGLPAPFWVVVCDWLLTNETYVLTVVTLALAAWLLWHLWQRWPAIIRVLANPSLNADVPHAGLRPGSGPPVS